VVIDIGRELIGYLAKHQVCFE